MRHFLLLLITLLCGSALDAVPTPIEILGPVRQVPPQCADPTYACQDLENARKCNVVKSCINDVWATMSAPEDNENICDLCKEMVKEARDQLLSNMTQEELKEVFEGSCRLLPVKLIADGCIKLVDQFIPDLVEMLASRMDPNMVCTVAGLCNMAHLPIEDHFRDLLKLAALHVDADKCTECTTIMTEVKTLVSQMSEPDFKQMVTKLCEEEVIAPLCTTVVDAYAAETYQFIITSDAKTVCTKASVCPSVNKVVKVPLVHKKVGDDLVCQFCTNVLEHIKEMIIANTTMEQFKTALLNFCTHLGKFSTECTKIVDDYYDMIFDDIRKMDTKGVCTFIGLCQSGVDSKTTSPLVKLFPAETLRKHPKTFTLTPSVPVKSNRYSQPWVKLVPPKSMSKKEFRKEADIETNDIFGSAAKSQLPMTRLGVPMITINRNLDCPFCKAISFFLRKDLKSDRNRDGVTQAINEVCTKWVNEFPDECSSFLQKYSGAVENHIVESNDFDSLCADINACPLEEEDTTGVNVRVIAPTSAPGGEICDLCKKVCDEAETLVKNPRFQSSIKQFFEQGCHVLPEKQKCIDFVDQNVDKLLAIIEENLQGTVACPALHLCPAGSPVHLSPSVRNIECDLCKDLVQQLADTLQDPQTKQAVKSAMERGCTMLPQQLSTQCKTFIDENIDAIIQIIIGSLNPDIVCATLNICPDSGKLVIPPSNDVECDVCKEIVQKVEDELKDQKTEEAIKEALENVCSYLPSSIQAKCKTFIDTYTEMLITLFLQELTPDEICAALNICPKPKTVVQPPVNNDLECDLCEEVVQKVIDEIKDQKTEDAIKSALEKVCGYLPSSMQTKCKTLVETYTDMLITLLMQELTAEEVCAALKLCPESKKIVQPPVNNVCDLCKEVVQKVIDEIKDQKTEEAIKDALKKVCDDLPSSMRDNCKILVETYTDALINLIMQELTAEEICTVLSLCSGQKEIKPPKNDVECDLCKQVVGMVEKELKDKKTEDAIRDALDKVCSFLPSSVSARCQTFVNTYTELLISILVQEMDPTMVCAALNVCPTQDFECESCQYLFHYLQEQLYNNESQDELKNFAKRFCDLLPQTFANNCEAFVDEYGSSLLVLLGQEIDPSVVCPRLGMCPSTRRHVSAVVRTANVQSVAFDGCTVCTTVVDCIDKLLEDDNVDKEITDVVEKVCNIVPSSAKDKCAAIIETYGPYILQMIGQVANSKQVCQDIDLCSRPPGHVHLLGGNKCTFGPSYWCQSKAHASACKAEMYCTQKVWKD